MARTNDRWVSRILSLPVFDQAFGNAVSTTPLANMAFVAAMESQSPGEFVQTALDWARSWDPQVLICFGERVQMLEQYWHLCRSAEKLFFESTAVQLGFGMCELASDRGKKALGSEMPTALASLAGQHSKPPKRSSSGLVKPSTATPLLDKEHGEKLKWAARLEEIGKRAKSHAKLFTEQDQSDSLSAGELSKLRQLVLTAGAHRTMAGHVKIFERFEKWVEAQRVDMYPLAIDVVLKYALVLDRQECGPTVLTSLKTALRWVCSRLGIDPPDLDDHRFVSLQQKIVTERAKILKEAVPLPLGVVGALESQVVNEGNAIESRVFMWWMLCMIYASLRFDDAVHVNPKELIMKEEGLFGVAWQTKVDRKRMGTRFMVPKVGFRQAVWLEIGWAAFKRLLPRDRDFWIPELNTVAQFKDHPPTYQRSVQWFKYFARQASDRRPELDASEKHQDAVAISAVTAHSCRVTLLDAAVHAGRSAQEIGLQANWKDPGPLVLKYTRNRTQVPARMIKNLVQELVASDHPAQESDDVLPVDVGDSDLNAPEFFIKIPAHDRAYEYKYHVTASHDQSVLACGKFSISECQSVGSILPDPSVLCKGCARNRPDVGVAQ